MQHGLAKLEQAGERDGAARAHRDHLLALADAWLAPPRYEAIGAWLRTAVLERANFMPALVYSRSAGEFSVRRNRQECASSSRNHRR